MLKIAITGKMRSGKSELAGHLERKHGFKRVSFGESLKYYADILFADSEAFPIEYEEFGEPCPFDGKRPKRAKKPRRLYQLFGQKMRELDADIWIRHAEKSAETWAELRSTRGIVIDDLRQPNEYEWAKANGYTIIRVNANEDTRLSRARVLGDEFNSEDLRHETELHVDDYEVDYDIWNDEGVGEDELRRRVDEILAEIKAKGERYNEN